MPTFLRSVVVEAPVETVFGFHEREDALRLLSPAFPPVRRIRPMGVIGKYGGIEPGSRSTRRMKRIGYLRTGRSANRLPNGFTGANLKRWTMLPA